MQVILAAEADLTVRQLLTSVVSEVPGWAITTVADGALLLGALDTVSPSLILLEVSLPGLTGLEAYKRIRERENTREVPILFLTTDTAAVRKAHLSGPHDVLSKPFDVDTLLRRAAKMMGEPPPEL